MSNYSKLSIKSFLFACSLTLFSLSENVEAKENCEIDNTSRFDIRHRDPRGVGYTEGYTTLGSFLTYDKNKAIVPFLDLRGHVFNDGKLAANAGFGARFATSSDWIIGANAFYDYREDFGPFHQAGLGLEGLYSKVDIRVKGSILIRPILSLEQLP